VFAYHELQEEVAVGLPDRFELMQNFPNPFNPVTSIRCELPFESKVVVTVFDVSGRTVAVPVNEVLKGGRYTFRFEAGGLASGVYFYRMTAKDFVQTRKMMLLK
jgi:hypothetical protein